ncbi:MAG: CHAT domain-containing protein [Bacteroidota bacterium]
MASDYLAGMGKKYQYWIQIGALFLAIGITPFSWGQSANELWQRGIDAYKQGQTDSCAFFLFEAADIYEEKEDWDSVAWCYRYSLASYNSQKAYEQTIQLGKQGLARIQLKGYGYVRVAMIVGYAQGQVGQLLGANETFEKAYLVSIREQLYDKEIGNHLYRPLANLATRFGEYERAKGLLQKWLLQLQITDQPEFLQQEAASNLSLVWLSLEQPDSALRVINQALILDKGILLSQGQVWTRLAEIHFMKNNFHAGLFAAQEAISILKEVPIDEEYWELGLRIGHYSAAMEVMGELLEATGQWKLAQEAYEEALHLQKQQSEGFPDRQQAKILVKRGDLAWRQGESKPSKDHYLAALASLTGVAELQALDSTTVFAENTFYEILPGLAQVYEEEQQYDSARWALRWGLVAGQALWQSLNQESAKLALSQSLHSLYGEAVRLAMQEGAVEEALGWHEAHRAAYLQENAARNQLERQYLPDSLLRLSRRMKASLQLPGVSDDQRFAWSQAYDTLQAYLQTNYPVVDASLSAPALREVQEKLARSKGGSLVLSYAWYPPYLYGWAISDDNLQAYQWEAPALPEQVAGLEALLTQVDQITERPLATRMAYFQQSHEVFRRYVQPLLESASANQPLLFLPDGPLQTIPLEVLMTDSVATSWQTAPYLLRERAVGYLPGLQWLLTEASEPSGEELIALAAQYPNAQQEAIATQLAMRDGEVPLPFAREEVEHLTRNWPSQALFSATKEDFRELAPQANVLHLAMHAYTNLEASQLSGLQFSPSEGRPSHTEFLSQAELQATPLQARLVTLSACNTGVGTPVPGEGPLSLARSFLQAGAEGVTMSLWRVPDQETARLMEGYYAALAEALPPTQALRQAKLDYLQRVTDPLRAHPFFWSGFVHTGQDEPLSEGRSSLWVYITGGGILVILVGFLVYRRRV